MGIPTASGLTYLAMSRKLDMDYKVFRFAAARYEYVIGPPARIGNAYVLSPEQAAELEKLIRAERKVGA